MTELIIIALVSFLLGIIISQDDKFQKDIKEYYRIELDSCYNDIRNLTEKIFKLELDNKELKKQLEKNNSVEKVIPEDKFDKEDYIKFVENLDNIQFNDLEYVERIEREVK